MLLTSNVDPYRQQSYIQCTPFVQHLWAPYIHAWVVTNANCQQILNNIMIVPGMVWYETNKVIPTIFTIVEKEIMLFSILFPPPPLVWLNTFISLGLRLLLLFC